MLFIVNIFKKRKRFLKIVISIIFLFAFLYTILDINQVNDKDNNTTYFAYNSVPNKTLFQKIYNKIYLSISTLTTLGFGDIYPIHPLSQTIIAIQTFFTYFLISELVK